MATTTSVTSNYAGTVAGKIIGKAFKEADTLSKNLITVNPNIDFQVSLRKIRYTDGRVDYTCGFAPTGTVTLTEKLLTPKKIKNEQELCKEDFRQVWDSASMGFSAHNDNMPKDENTALLNEILKDTAEATDNDIWNGDATNTGEFDGFVTLFTADASVIKANNGIVPTGSAITKSNVITEFEKVMNALPVALRRSKDLVYGVSPDVALAYEQALISAGISNGFGGKDMPLQYGSRTMEVINGLADNTIVAYEKKNLVFGTGLMADHNSIRIKDMDDYDLTGMVRYKMVYTAGVQYVNSEDIVWYLSTTTPS
jgi:hypothetical protein